MILSGVRIELQQLSLHIVESLFQIFDRARSAVPPIVNDDEPRVVLATHGQQIISLVLAPVWVLKVLVVLFFGVFEDDGCFVELCELVVCRNRCQQM